VKTLLLTLGLTSLAWTPHVTSAAEPQRVEGLHERSRVVGFSPDGNTLLVVGRRSDGGSALRHCDFMANTSRLIVEIEPDFEPAVSPDFKRVAYYNGKTSQIHVVEVSTGKQLAALGDGQSRFGPDELLFSADGKRLFEAPRQQPVQNWDAVGGKPLGVLGDAAAGHMWIHGTPDRSKLLIAGTTIGKHLGNGKGLAQIWDPAKGSLLADMQMQPETRICVMARISPDAKTVVAAELGQAPKVQLTLWDAASGERRALLDDAVDLSLIMSSGRRMGGLPIAFSADGSLLATMTSKGVKVWDASTGKLARTLPAASGMALMIAFAPSGSVLAVSYGDELPLKIAPDKQPPLSDVNGHVQLWDAAAGELEATLDGVAPYPMTLAFAPDGSRLATASYTWRTGPGHVYVWETGHWVPKPATSSVPLSTPVKIERRTWTDSTGTYRIDATYVRVQGEAVQLKRAADGQVISVPLNRLSEADRRYVSGLRKQLADPKQNR